MTTFIPVKSLLITSLSFQGSNVILPLAYLLQILIKIILSWRSGSCAFSLHLNAFEACIQEATLPGRLWMHIYRSRVGQGLPYHQYNHLFY